MTIDWWTLALQTVNFLVLVWILARFFFRPVSAIVAHRQAAAAKVLADAEATHELADRAKADGERARAEIKAERERLLAEARAEADRERARIIADAADAARLTGAEAAAAIARERMTMEAGLVDRIRSLALEIARRLLDRLPPAATLDGFVQALCEQVPALQPATRAVFASANDGEVDVVTATALSREEIDLVRGALERAFGAPLTLSFHADPAVIAGIELHSRHAFIKSSWREDLDRIGKALRVGR